MIKLLINLFIKDNNNTSDFYVREKHLVLSGILGIVCNLILFIIKLFIGLISGSIAIVSDGFNNFSDMGASVVSIIGSKMSNLSADKEHPFGHGRIEYVSSLIVSFIIILVGFELFKESIFKIINPKEINVTLSMLIILILSLFIKIWMFSYNKYIYKKTGSQITNAVAKDSLNDVIATLSVIIAVFISSFTLVSVDAYLGVIVSVFIMYSGYTISKDTISTLLGKEPEPELVKKIEDVFNSDKDIIGIHDLTLHDYGPGRVMGSVHAEVSEDKNIVEIHEAVDRIENYIEDTLGVHLVIHMDPTDTNSELLSDYKNKLNLLLFEIDKELSFHDMRITNHKEQVNLIFDLCVPVSYKQYQRDYILDEISKKLKDEKGEPNLIIKIDNKF
ncbi:MAG: cation transporter [Clostridia bacterium]|nr:cation transporter [Clostridia bacterium]